MVANDEVLDEASLPADLHAVEEARRLVRRVVAGVSAETVDDCCLVVSELVTNALLHAVGPVRVRVRRRGQGVRIEVVDAMPDRLPVASGTGLADVLALDVADPTVDDFLDVESMTGRGLLMVAAIADGWGVDVDAASKTVWADLGSAAPTPTATTGNGAASGAVTGNVRLLAVPARLVLASAANLDDLVRECQVLDSRDTPLGSTAGRLLATSSHAREPVRIAAHDAIAQGERLLNVSMAVGDAIVDALQQFLEVVGELTGYCRRGELLTMEASPEIQAFRAWYVEEITRQVQGARPRACPFPAVALDDPSVLEAAERAAGHFAGATGRYEDRPRAAAPRPVDVTPGPADVVGPQIARILLERLGAASTSICVADLDAGVVRIGWADDYPDEVISGWTTFGLYDDLPASEVIRTGLPSFFRTVEERDARFPIFTRTPVVGDEALAVLPIGDFAALVVGFADRQPFLQDERTLLVAVAAAAGKALQPAEVPR